MLPCYFFTFDCCIHLQNIDEFNHLLDALANYDRSPLQTLTFQTALNWWLISLTEGLRGQVKDYLHILVQLRLV
jgi:hypothetical protein